MTEQNRQPLSAAQDATSATKRTWRQRLALAILHWLGWTLRVEMPTSPKNVITAAPHTSNWDFMYLLLLLWATNLPLNWVGKDTLFRGPMGGIMRRLGGIPVNRRVRTNFVAQIADAFQQYDRLMVVITPEGTRGKSPYWHTGFYYIALMAGVPIVLGFIDYKKRELGLGPSFRPTGNIEADFDIMRRFYADKIGQYPHSQGEIRLKPPSASP